MAATRTFVALAVIAASVGSAAMPDRALADLPTAHPTSVAVAVPAGATLLTDDTSTISVMVPDTWTATDTDPAMRNDGGPRPKIVASPNSDELYSGFTTGGVWFGVVPVGSDPAGWLAAYRFDTDCADGGRGPFEDGRFVGVAQVWVSCAGTTSQVIQIAATTADGALGAFVQVQTTSPDDPAVELVLESFGVVPGATIPTNSAVAASGPTVDTADAALVDFPVPTDARRVRDSSGRLAMAVPAAYAEIDMAADVNDDASTRPSIGAAPDLQAYRGSWNAAGVSAVLLPAVDPGALLRNRSLAGACTDAGTRPYSDGTLSGLMQTWTECANTQTRVVQAAIAPADGSATVFVFAQLPDADTTPLQIALSSIELR